MASFVEDLWMSIFTPGPTHTLLVATNVTFAALQTLLLVLLLATYSIHFVVLSFLSGALWWSINWFAKEIRDAQAQSAPDDLLSEKTTGDGKETDRQVRRSPDGADSETETESLLERKSATASPPLQPVSTSTTLQPPSANEVRKRLSVGGDSSGYTSTDSEWEKVDDKTS